MINTRKISRITLVSLVLFLAMVTCSNKKQPTIEQMYDEIVCNEIAHPEIVLAQTINECGWDYGSYNATKRNNFFGMTGGKKSESNKYGYKVFSHWTESVYDYKCWQEKRYKGEDDYYAFLVRWRYAQSQEYCDDLRVIIRDLVTNGIITECGL